jgi:O-antigen ligase
MELLGLLALPFFIYSTISFCKKPSFAVTSILILSLLNAWFIVPPSVKLGLNIYLHDLAFIPLFFSALYRLSFKKEWYSTSPLWMGVGLLVFLNLFIGLKQIGTAAGVDVRSIFYYWSGTLYFMSFSYRKVMLDRIVKYWLSICFVLLLVVYFRFVAEFLHFPIAATWIAADPTGVRFRVVNSGQSYLLGVSVLMLFHRYVVSDDETAKPSRLLIVLFTVAVVALQHRSVWAATLTGILTLFLLPGVKKHKLIGKFMMLGAVGIVVLLPLLSMGYLDNFIESISGSAEKATSLSTGTFGARRKAWEQIMNYWVNQNFLHQFLGDPFGSPYAGLRNSPHNFFFQSLLRVGMLGNFFISVFYIGILLKLYVKLLNERHSRFYPTLFFMLVVGQMTFYIPYAPQAEHGILLGIAASLAKRGIVASKDENVPKNTQYFQNAPDSKILS